MSLEFFLNNPEWLWIVTVFYDLFIVVSLFYFFGKNGLFVSVILGSMTGVFGLYLGHEAKTTRTPKE